MSDQTNGTDDGLGRAPSFVGGAFGVTSRELEGDAADDPVAAFGEVEDAEDTGPDVTAAADVPSHLQEDVSLSREEAGPADVEGAGDEPSPGERNEPV